MKRKFKSLVPSEECKIKVRFEKREMGSEKRQFRRKYLKKISMEHYTSVNLSQPIQSVQLLNDGQMSE